MAAGYVDSDIYQVELDGASRLFIVVFHLSCKAERRGVGARRVNGKKNW